LGSTHALGGVISGTGTISKLGAGTLTLANSQSSYTARQSSAAELSTRIGLRLRRAEQHWSAQHHRRKRTVTGIGLHFPRRHVAIQGRRRRAQSRDSHVERRDGATIDASGRIPLQR
jgi:hypothetical protein